VDAGAEPQPDELAGSEQRLLFRPRGDVAEAVEGREAQRLEQRLGRCEGARIDRRQLLLPEVVFLHGVVERLVLLPDGAGVGRDEATATAATATATTAGGEHQARQHRRQARDAARNIHGATSAAKSASTRCSGWRVSSNSSHRAAK